MIPLPVLAGYWRRVTESTSCRRLTLYIKGSKQEFGDTAHGVAVIRCSRSRLRRPGLRSPDCTPPSVTLVSSTGSSRRLPSVATPGRRRLPTHRSKVPLVDGRTVLSARPNRRATLVRSAYGVLKPLLNRALPRQQRHFFHLHTIVWALRPILLDVYRSFECSPRQVTHGSVVALVGLGELPSTAVYSS
jgi:hypothetical protein